MTRTRRRACALGLGGVLALLASPVLAQIPDETPITSPILAGPFALYPWIETKSEHTDNLFFASGRAGNPEVSTGVLTATPGILAELPFRESRVRFGYAMRYQDFTEIEEDWSRFSHTFLGEADLQFSSGLRLEVRDDYERGVLDTRVFDPGGELTFRGDEFTSNSARIELSMLHADRRLLAFRAGHQIVRFDRAFDPENPSAFFGGFFDSDAVDLGVSGGHRRGRRTWIEWNVEAGRTDLERPLPSMVDDVRRADDLLATLGLRIDPNPNASFTTAVGWKRSEYTSDSPDVYSGPTVRIVYRHRSPGRVNISARLTREVYPSVYRDNDYYVSDQVSVDVASSPRSRLVLGARAAYFVNDYPEPEPLGGGTREDTVLDGVAWFGYRFRPGLQWNLYLRTASRTSTVDGLEYDANRIGFTFRVGG